MKKLVVLCLLVLALPAAAETRLFSDAPLVKAVRAGDLDSAKAALLAEPKANMTSNGTPLLQLAAEKGQLAMVELLVRHKADVNRADRLGMTALMVAAEAGHVEVLDALIAAGADVNAPNKQGLTALMIGARKGQREVVAHLLSAGAKAELSDYSGRTARDWAQDSRDRATIALLP